MWTNSKYKKLKFSGSYEFDKDGQRIFVLKCEKRKITFESWQMAKKLGWSK